MELSDILSPEAVGFVARPVSKKRILQDISARAAQVYGVDADAALDALQERESLGPTGVGDGVGLPHARLAGLDRVVGVFFRLEKPVDYDSVDRQPVDLLFALFAPVNSGVDHLKALACVSRLLREPSTRAKLRANEEPGVLYAVLTEMAANKAA